MTTMRTRTSRLLTCLLASAVLALWAFELPAGATNPSAWPRVQGNDWWSTGLSLVPLAAPVLWALADEARD